MESNLFSKLQTKQISKKSFFKVNGGGPKESNATGDNECTVGGQDCGDNVVYTDVFTDSTPTSSNSDGCELVREYPIDRPIFRFP
nr:hypothetical protein [uncultured Flavobacterium sp.]